MTYFRTLDEDTPPVALRGIYIHVSDDDLLFVAGYRGLYLICVAQWSVRLCARHGDFLLLPNSTLAVNFGMQSGQKGGLDAMSPISFRLLASSLQRPLLLQDL